MEQGASADTVSILDVGAGRGDLLGHLGRALERRGTALRAMAGDPHPGALALAREGAGGPALLRLRGSGLPLADGSVDFVVSTITLHHLDRDRAARFLAEADRVARRGWIVVDLRRSLPTRWAVRLLAATVWRRNPLPRHDGPVSARRAFRVPEVRDLLRTAGVPDGRVSRGPPFHLTVRGGCLARRGSS